MLVVRLMWSLTAQRRLSIITLTLTQSASGVAHLLLLTGAVSVLLVAFGAISFGPFTQRLASVGGALRSECAFLGFLYVFFMGKKM